MRDKIKAEQDKFTVPFRVENKVNWLHFDIYDTGSGRKYNEFNP